MIGHSEGGHHRADDCVAFDEVSWIVIPRRPATKGEETLLLQSA